MQNQQRLTKLEFIYLVAVTVIAADLASHLTNEHGRLIEFFSFIYFATAYVLLLYRRQVATLRLAEAEILRGAYVDSLTGLPNRRSFFEALRSFQACLQQGRQFCVGLLDLDRFKPLNDLYGHRIGDEVLRITGRRLKALLGEESVVARIGGDEFGIIVPGPPNDGPARDPNRIVNRLQEPLQLDALSLGVGVSLGLVCCSGEAVETNSLGLHESDPVETIVRRADMALYRAKKSGSRCEFFVPQMDQDLKQRVELEHGMLNAVRMGEVVPYYQPVVDLRSGQIKGFEVLARWIHPKQGVLLPSVFLSTVKSTGAMRDMTYSLMETALAEVPAPYAVSINLDPLMLTDGDLIERIPPIISKCAFHHSRLQFEITEAAFLAPSPRVVSALKALRALGIRIAIDDFGERHSGFSYLQDFRIDGIKIDRSFASRILSDSDDEKLVRAMIAFGRALGLQTTIKGIECFDCWNRIAHMGCEFGQGFYFGRPAPKPDLSSATDLETHRELGKRLAS